MPLTIQLDPNSPEWAEALERLKHGERVLLTCGDKAVLVGSETAEGKRPVPRPSPETSPLWRGVWKGKVYMAPDFNDPLPEFELNDD